MQAHYDSRESDKNEIGQKIRSVRQDHGISQDKLADLMGTDRNQIYRHENGHNDMSVCTLLQYADAFGIQPQELLPERYNPSSVSDQVNHLLSILQVLNPEDLQIIQLTAEHLQKIRTGMQHN